MRVPMFRFGLGHAFEIPDRRQAEGHQFPGFAETVPGGPEGDHMGKLMAGYTVQPSEGIGRFLHRAGRPDDNRVIERIGVPVGDIVRIQNDDGGSLAPFDLEIPRKHPVFVFGDLRNPVSEGIILMRDYPEMLRLQFPPLQLRMIPPVWKGEEAGLNGKE